MMIDKNRKCEAPQTLAKLIPSLEVKSISQHGSVSPVPKSLKVQTEGLYFIPENEEMLNFLTFCTSVASLDVLWVMKLTDGVLMPWGVAITNAKQLTLPHGSSVHMQ